MLEPSYLDTITNQNNNCLLEINNQTKQTKTFSDVKLTNSNSSNLKINQICQNCGIPSATKYIKFYENVGMLILRKHRSVEGYFCKKCIDYYFWNFTGKTMLLGWWGVISFIITPFILLNNLFLFISSNNVKEPSYQIVPSPSPFWIFSTISGFILIIFLISMLIF